jgi:hypothetical protein
MTQYEHFQKISLLYMQYFLTAHGFIQTHTHIHTSNDRITSTSGGGNKIN